MINQLPKYLANHVQNSRPHDQSEKSKSENSSEQAKQEQILRDSIVQSPIPQTKSRNSQMLPLSPGMQENSDEKRSDKEAPNVGGNKELIITEQIRPFMSNQAAHLNLKQKLLPIKELQSDKNSQQNS